MSCQNCIYELLTLLSATGHSADKNTMLRHDSNQYLSGKQSPPVAAYYNKQNICCPNRQKIQNMKNKTAKSDSNTRDIYKYCLLFVIYLNVAYFTLSYLRAVHHYT